MYRKEKSIQLKSSSAALYNNLSVLRLPGRQLACFSAVHGPSVNVVSAAADGLGFSHRQLQAKEGGMAVSTSILTQAAWCVLPSRVLLVLTSQKGIQMYESDGSIMVYWHALDVTEHPPGTSSGVVLVFDIPPKGTNITVSEVLEQHRDAITDIAAELGQAPDGAGDLVTADDNGTLCVWSTGEEFTLVSKIPAFGEGRGTPNTSPWHVGLQLRREEVKHAPVSSCTCSSVKLWNGVVAAGYGNGQIRLYEAATGLLRAEVNAHARWIYALDLAPETGKLLSGAEDSFVHVWKLSRNLDTDDVKPLVRHRGHREGLTAQWKPSWAQSELPAACDPQSCPGLVEIEHCHAECVTDTQVCGARFCDSEGNSFAVTGYDLSEIFRYGRA
ncbi:wd repeat-containing protein 54 [Limosa lapponica baueri]|uniref:Wd repeat-containing protein 54 n=1 Tax=Limosa lapponica baueri TaxID=1758121 RepID=A0A2I0UL63_LIMLA|nr:wd repeat-containing protein 54 [Limosa lapponica baueri]